MTELWAEIRITVPWWHVAALGRHFYRPTRPETVGKGEDMRGLDFITKHADKFILKIGATI